MEQLLTIYGPWAVTLVVGIFGFVVREYIKGNKEELRLFKEQLLINADEHRDIMISIAKLTEHLPDILECEEEVEKLKSSNSKAWSKLKEHDNKLDEHHEQLKKLVA